MPAGCAVEEPPGRKHGQDHRRFADPLPAVRPHQHDPGRDGQAGQGDQHRALHAHQDQDRGTEGRSALPVHVLRHAGTEMMGQVLKGTLLGIGTFAVFDMFDDQALLPRSVLIASGTFSFLGLLSYRLMIRWILRVHLVERRNNAKQNVVIYGAGLAGLQLLASLRQNSMYQVVAFLDDDLKLQGIGNVHAGVEVVVEVGVAEANVFSRFRVGIDHLAIIVEVLDRQHGRKMCVGVWRNPKLHLRPWRECFPLGFSLDDVGVWG